LKRTRLYSLVLATLVAGSSLGLQFVPEHILFRQRLLFPVLEMDPERPLQAFDHRTHDGLTLRSWYKPPEPGRPVIVYFPGRDGNILFKPWHLFELAEKGYGLLLAGYRGYGGNPGRPREFSMHLDAVSLVSQAGDAGLMTGGYVLYGYSMGSAFAANAASGLTPMGLILEAPISRFIDAVRQQARFVPGWMVRTRFDNVSRLAELSLPILLLAGGRDHVTPVSFATLLAEVSQPHATLHVMEDANHFTIIRRGGKAIVESFLDRLTLPHMDISHAGDRSGPVGEVTDGLAAPAGRDILQSMSPESGNRFRDITKS